MKNLISTSKCRQVQHEVQQLLQWRLFCLVLLWRGLVPHNEMMAFNLKISLKTYPLQIFLFNFHFSRGEHLCSGDIKSYGRKVKDNSQAERGTVILWKIKSSRWAVFTSGLDFSNAVIIHPLTDSYHPAYIQE